MLSKVFTFFSGLITGVFTGLMLVSASMTLSPEIWKKVIKIHISDEE